MSLTASEITKSVLKELNARGCEMWRQNQIRVPGRRFVGKRGVGDTIGYHRRTGLFVAVEVKTENDTLSDEQIEFLSKLGKSGGIALVATEVDGKIRIITFFDYITGQLIEANLSELLNLKRKIA
jgi:hypothetical protein